MRVSTRVRYAARALAELAENWDDGKPMKLTEIAEHQDISKKYLEQLFLPLKAAGIVVSVRGPNGGYKLARSPENVTFFELTKILEGQRWLVDCLRSPDVCPRSKFCAARKAWQRINKNLQDSLKSISLADLVDRSRKRK